MEKIIQISSLLPHINAILNSMTMTLLVIGFALIRKRKEDTHCLIMMLAVVVSIFFLLSYLVYHFTVPILEFSSHGLILYIYYVIMVTHIVLAMVMTPMVAVTAWYAIYGCFDRHRILAHWTFPVWLYVSVTGIIVYTMLYYLPLRM